VFWPTWSGEWGWIAGLITAFVWIGLIVLAVWFLRRELPHLKVGRRIPALNLLEERYARGEISRQEFLDRRAVLIEGYRKPYPAAGQTEHSEGPPAPPSPASTPEPASPTEQTQPLPPNQPPS
jgi:hypothetical protein